MGKAEFREWLQTKLDASDCREEYGDLWRDIECQGLLPDGVTVAVDHVGHVFIFQLQDGLLASNFETGIEGHIFWYFFDDEAAGNLRDYTPGEVECALWRARGAVCDLEAMLTGRPGAGPPTTP